MHSTDKADTNYIVAHNYNYFCIMKKDEFEELRLDFQYWQIRQTIPMGSRCQLLHV